MAQKRIDYYGKFTPTGVDTSQAKRLQALSGLAESVSDIAFEVGAGIQERRGREAGLKAGQEAAEKGEAIETQQGLLSQLSIFDQAYNNALTKAYVASVNTDTQENINRILTDNPDDIDSFDTVIKDYRLGVINNVADEFQPQIMMSMDQAIASARAQVHQAQTAKNLQIADDRFVRSFEISRDRALRSARLNDEDDLAIAEFNAFSAIDSRVEAGMISYSAGETEKQKLLVGIKAEKVRGGLQVMLKNDASPTAALDYISKFLPANLIASDFSVEEQERLVDVLRADLREFIAMEGLAEAEEEEAREKRQTDNYMTLFVGIINGEKDIGDVTRASLANDITPESARSLTTTLQTRGQGIDNYEFIYEVQTKMYTNPTAAREEIARNTGSQNLTSATALQLLRSLDEEPILNTPKANRYRNFVKNSIATTDILGNITGDNKKRASFLMFQYDERVLAGEAPEDVAQDLISIDDIANTKFEILYKNLDQQYEDGEIDDTEYNSEYESLKEQEQRLQNFENLMNSTKKRNNNG
jgi:hypothetical protein